MVAFVLYPRQILVYTLISDRVNLYEDINNNAFLVLLIPEQSFSAFDVGALSTTLTVATHCCSLRKPKGHHCFLFSSLSFVLFCLCFVFVRLLVRFVFVVDVFFVRFFKGLILVRKAKVGDAGGAARSELEAAHEGEWKREGKKNSREINEN